MKTVSWLNPRPMQDAIDWANSHNLNWQVTNLHAVEIECTNKQEEEFREEYPSLYRIEKPICPDGCGDALKIQKCPWELGGDCPRHEVEERYQRQQRFEVERTADALTRMPQPCQQARAYGMPFVIGWAESAVNRILQTEHRLTKKGKEDLRMLLEIIASIEKKNVPCEHCGRFTQHTLNCKIHELVKENTVDA